MRKLLLILIIILTTLVACSEKAPSPPATPESPASPESNPVEAPEEKEGNNETAVITTSDGEAPIYLAIIWHQHQPVYFQDPETGDFVKPWVRVHATKDYVDMAATLAEYPDVKATFNITPSLIRQLLALSDGVKDHYWTLTEIPADTLTDDDKQFILDRFFDTNRSIIERFPRYHELLLKRDASDDPLSDYTTEDFRDLQLLFNLAWTDPDWLAEEPLASLVAQEHDYSEADKQILLEEHLRLIKEVIPIHRDLQDAGQIEITMTPYAHPILPLLMNTDLAKVALPDIETPTPFIFGADAVKHVELGVALYEEQFGQPPTGMWPAEGSVAQEIVSIVSNNGIRWMASDEGVLANSLGFDGFSRDTNDVVQDPAALYRPYYVQGGVGDPVAMVFRDVVISDKVGFTYSGLSGNAAAEDFVTRIHDIRHALQASGEEGPFLVSVILDGENAWEHYDNDGKEFLHGLYQRLSDDPDIITVTPSEFLEIAPEQPAIERLWAGSWINHDFATWIGEEEENRGWEYLLEARELLQKYQNGVRTPPSEEALAAAEDLMYVAEGSDWFWWYGADQNSSDDRSFDLQFRDTLKEMYVALGEEPPTFLDIPIIPEQPVLAARTSTDLISPTIDGSAAPGEWDAGGQYVAEGNVMASADSIIEAVTYGFDGKNLSLLYEFSSDVAELLAKGTVETYLSKPGGGEFANFTRNGTLLGTPANCLVEVTADSSMMYSVADEAWLTEGTAVSTTAFSDNTLEIAIPLTDLGKPDIGDWLSARFIYAEEITDAESVDTAIVPGSGPAVMTVPDLGTTTLIIDITDPSGDDHGPGSYTYPTDSVFSSGNFDIVNFQAGFDEENIVFKFIMDGPVNNPWGGSNNLSLQTFDIYIDQDGDGEGGVAFLPGRNAALVAGSAWDYAIHIEGWTSSIYVPGEPTPERIAETSEFFVLADSGQQKVTIRIPKHILGDDPENWRYAAAVLGQEGFPSDGVWRVRDVVPTAEDWRIGGAPENTTNHTRIMDLVWAEEGQQEAWLSEFTPSDTDQADLTVDDFARVEMFGTE
ncbi:MAG: glycoside hydrolase [Chloroflexi bacterium]|nr:MAG: glycoside hydrolase [Chloroflexota bacterium]